MKKIISLKILSISLLLTFGACADLDVEYKNYPDIESALSNPQDVYNIAQAGFFNWYMTNTSSVSPRMAMWVAADQGTCSWANSGMLDLSSEPRTALNNDVTYTYARTYENYYQELYGNISQMNDVLIAMNEGMEIGDKGKDNPMLRANALIIRGMSYGYLALVYDKLFIVSEETDLEGDLLEAVPYTEVMDFAIASLNEGIQVCNDNNFTIPAEWFGGQSYSNLEFAQMAHSFIARFMVQNSRSVTQNSATDWAMVLEHAQKGIQKPVMPYIDGVKWKQWFYHYTIRPGWAKIDLRIINLMDTLYPSRFPDTGDSPGAASSADARLESDFNFSATINMKPERGYYHYSNYEYSRIDLEYVSGVITGDATDFSIAENDLLVAEAMAETGDLPGAIAVINAGTRTTRGMLSPVPDTATKEEVLAAIFYERDVELIMTGFGIAFFDMRRRDMLQEGTLLHYPMPAKELMLLQLPIYTFGGTGNADGINTSNGGWE